MPQVRFTPSKSTVRFTPRPREDAAAIRNAQDLKFAPSDRRNMSGPQLAVDRARGAISGGLDRLGVEIDSPVLGTAKNWAKGLGSLLTTSPAVEAALDLNRPREQQTGTRLVDEISKPYRGIYQGFRDRDAGKIAEGAGGALVDLVTAWSGTARGRAATGAAIKNAGGLPGHAASVIPAIRSGAGNMADRLYESALKPAPRSNSLADVRRMVKTGLDEGISVSERGTKKLHRLVDELDSQVSGAISAGNAQAPPINKYSVASRLNEPAKKFSLQVNPEADLAAISETGNEFLRNIPAEFDSLTAQSLKQGTYRQLKNRAFGEIKGAAVEGQKHLARGLKEEIESRFPNVKGMNQRSSDLFNLNPELAAAVNRGANRNIVGVGDAAVGLATQSATGSPSAAVGAGIIRKLFSSPAMKSRIAIGLSKLR